MVSFCFVLGQVLGISAFFMLSVLQKKQKRKTKETNNN